VRGSSADTSTSTDTAQIAIGRKEEQREEGRQTGKRTKAKLIREKGTSNRKEHKKRKRLQRKLH
jgi:hypothetical protein